MRYLVAGGAGFIGCNLSRKLLQEGGDVRVFDNFATGRQTNLDAIRNDIEIVEGDIRDPDGVAEALKGVDHVFLFAAMPSVSRSVEDPVGTNDINIGGMLNILTAARDAGVESFVFSSSSSVYGNTLELPKHEGMIPSPLSPYALQKLAGEHYMKIYNQLYGMRTYALRYFNVFGPRQDPGSHYAAVIPLFIDALRNGTSPDIHGDGGQTRDFTYVDNIVHANICCTKASAEAAGQPYNVACGDRISILQLFEKLRDMLGADGVEPNFTEARAGDVRDSQADSSRAREMLGWEPLVQFEEGLKNTVEWFAKD